MTPLQEFTSSIWALLPGLAPYLVVAWLVACAVAAGRLAVDEYNGEARSILSMVPICLWVGSMLTLLIILTEASDKGLLAHNAFAGHLVGSLAVTVSLLRGRSRRPAR
jgi:hypothetical protein